jgi:hypothetical protein
VLTVVGAEEERDLFSVRTIVTLSERLEHSPVLRLPPIASPELVPAGWIVAEPSAQLMPGRELVQPL